MDPRAKRTAAALADPAGFSTFTRKDPTVRARLMTTAFTVETPDSLVDGQPGDYLCLDEAGQPFVCRGARFDLTFTKVEP